MMHDAAHNALFKSRSLNDLRANAVRRAHSADLGRNTARYHLKHHRQHQTDKIPI